MLHPLFCIRYFSIFSRRRLVLCGITALLVACSTERIRDDARQQIRVGHYEEALRIYQEGLSQHPQDPILTAGLLNDRETMAAQLMTAAATARAAGNDALADATLDRAIAMHPADSRPQAMKLDVARDRRQQQAREEATDLLQKGLRERAMNVLDAALKDNPQHAGLMALKRQIELEDRRAQTTVAHLDETRAVSLDFREANLRMVMEVLTRNTGVNFVIDKEVRQDARTTIFLKQSRLEDALILLTTTSQLAWKILDPGTVLIYPNTPEKRREYQELLIRAFYLSNAEAKQTAQLLKSMLKIRDPFVDEKLNMIVVRETPEVIRMAERLIALHDLAEPEVLLEMEVLEVQRNSLTQFGITFPDTLTLTPLLPAGVTNATISSLLHINHSQVGVTNPSLVLNAHRDVGEANILANPKIRAKNHEKAKIMIGDKLPVVTTTGNANNNGFIAESVQYVDVGLKLNVEPSVYLDDEVGIKIGLEVSSLVNTIKTTAGSTVYQIGTRNVDTVLKLRDGETQLLAGLISKTEQSSANRVPGIGDLPLLGRLFSSQKDNGQRSEVVLSITPHIIRNVRRPDINETEFWSGTETDIRSRPLLPAKPQQNNVVAGDASRNGLLTPGLPSGATPAVGGEPQSTSPSSTLRIDAPKEVSVGQTFDVVIHIKADKAIRGVPLQLQFNPAKLEVLDAVEGTFLNSDHAATSHTKTLEQKEGRVSMAILRNVANDLAGEGTLMTFRFKALAAGESDVGITAARSIAVQPTGDLALPKPVVIQVK